MKWFKHQSDMRYDSKIRRLISKHGVSGYGVYTFVIEAIVMGLDADSPIPELEDTSQDIAEYLKMDTIKVEEILLFCLHQGLFEQNETTGRILCNKIYKYIDKASTRSVELKRMIENYSVKSLQDCMELSGTVTDCPGLSGTNSDCPEMSELDKNRIEQNRTEENKNILPEADKKSLQAGALAFPPAIFSIPRLGGSSYPITEELFDAFVKAYPALDVMVELKKMNAWLLSNKKNLKKDVPRFVNGWLSRAQDNAVKPSFEPSKNAYNARSNGNFSGEVTGDITERVFGGGKA